MMSYRLLLSLYIFMLIYRGKFRLAGPMCRKGLCPALAVHEVSRLPLVLCFTFPLIPFCYSVQFFKGISDELLDGLL